MIAEAIPLDALKVAMADGGEGTAAICAKCLGARPIEYEVHGAYGEILKVKWYWNEESRIAVFDTAAILGPGLKRDVLNPLEADSRGVGELLLEILKYAPSKILIGLGGVATVDGGKGMIEELMNGLPTIGIYPGDRKSIVRDKNDIRGIRRFLSYVEIVGLSDVVNPLLGECGAARVYGPQKGAHGEMIKELELRIENFARALCDSSWKEISERPGAGAAGGLGFALLALGGELKRGADVMWEMSGIEALIGEGSLVITGEGCSDHTTLNGKLPYRIMKRCKEKGAQVWLVSGMVKNRDELLRHGFDRVIELRNPELSLEENMRKDVLKENIKKKFPNISQSTLKSMCQ